MGNTGIAGIVVAIALATSLLAMPVVRRVCLRYGYTAKPRVDRWHHKPTATLGGTGIFVAFLVALVAVPALTGDASQVPWGLLAGSAVIFAIGLYDDLRELTPPAKLIGQILAAAVVVSLGYTTHFFTPRIANPIIAQAPNILLTFVWLVGITNAINLLDNMDGLAGGIALIAAGFLSYFFWQAGNTGLLLVSLALTGSLFGFLVYNFPPASIFMGDSGSLFLGFTLAAMAIARQPQASNVFAVMGVPTLLFLIPILDTSLVAFTRLLRGQSPAQGGRDHTSHRLIAFGLNERQAVLAFYSVALVSGIAAAALESVKYWFSLVIVPFLVISLALLTAYLGGLKVVTSPGTKRQEGAITRFMMELTYRRRILEILLDFFLISVAFYLAFLTESGFAITADILESFFGALPVALAGAYLSFYLFGVYRGVWRYVGVDDLLRYVVATMGAVVLSLVGVMFLSSLEVYPPELFLLFAVFLFFGLAASRSSFRLLDLLSNRQAQQGNERVLIWGVGDEGEMALRWIFMNPQLAYLPVGFLDPDPFMVGRQVHGVEVLGGLDHLEQLLERHAVSGIILTLPIAGGEAVQEELLDISRRCGCWVRSLRLEFELLQDGNKSPAAQTNPEQRNNE